MGRRLTNPWLGDIIRGGFVNHNWGLCRLQLMFLKRKQLPENREAFHNGMEGGGNRHLAWFCSITCRSKSRFHHLKIIKMTISNISLHAMVLGSGPSCTLEYSSAAAAATLSPRSDEDLSRP